MTELEGSLMASDEFVAPWDWSVVELQDLCDELSRLKLAATTPTSELATPATACEWNDAMRDLIWRLRGLRGEPPEAILRRQLVDFGPAVCRRLQLRCTELLDTLLMTHIEYNGTETRTFLVPAPYAERFESLVLGGYACPAWIGYAQLCASECVELETIDHTRPGIAPASAVGTRGAQRARRRSPT
jgi:hypothetical protein